MLITFPALFEPMLARYIVGRYIGMFHRLSFQVFHFQLQFDRTQGTAHGQTGRLYVHTYQYTKRRTIADSH